MVPGLRETTRTKGDVIGTSVRKDVLRHGMIGISIANDMEMN